MWFVNDTIYVKNYELLTDRIEKFERYTFIFTINQANIDKYMKSTINTSVD